MGTGQIKFADTGSIFLGDSNDLQIIHNATNSEIINLTGNLNIKNSSTDGDISFFGDNGSGGTTEYFRLDGGNVNMITSVNNVFIDNKRAAFGDSADLAIYHNGTTNNIESINGKLRLIQTEDDGDISFESDDGSGGITPYLTLDGNNVLNKFHQNLYLLDNVGLKIGNSFDLDIKHDGSDSYIQNATGHLYIKNSTDDKDIIFQCDDGSGGTTTYFFLDGSIQANRFQQNVLFDDNIKALFGGGSGDLQIYHDGSNSFIANTTGVLTVSNTGGAVTVDAGGDVNLDAGGNDIVLKGSGSEFGRLTNSSQNFIIKNTNADKDIILQADNGSGGVAEYFRVDGGNEHVVYSKPVIISDNLSLKFGDGTDLVIQHNQSASLNQIDNNNFDLYIQQNAADKDIIFRADDGSGGLAEYFKLDGSAVFTRFSKDARFSDNVRAEFGDSGDLDIYHDATDSFIESNTGNLNIVNYNDDKDIIFKSDDGSGGVTEYFRLDGSLADGNYTYTTRNDGGVITFGNSLDLRIWRDPIVNDSYIRNYTDDLIIETVADDKDIIFNCDDGSGGVTEYLRLDGSEKQIKFSEDAVFADSKRLMFGAGGDLQILHNATDSSITNTTGDLEIIQNADNKDIILKCDNGSGGNTPYLTLDGSNERLQVDAPNGMLFSDNIQAKFGTSGDLKIHHDGSNSFISDTGTGDLRILGSVVRLKSAGDENMIVAVENAGVTLYHNALAKLVTTSSGVEVTGFTDGSLADTGAGYNDGVARFVNSTTATSGGAAVMNVRNNYGAGFGGLIKFWRTSTSSSVGNISFNSDGSAVNYNTTSDYRLKEDLQDFVGIDLIQQIKVYDYKWIDYESRSYGVLAHELQEVLPGAVSGEKDDEEMQGVDYSKVVPVLIKAIQELKAEIELLKK